MIELTDEFFENQISSKNYDEVRDVVEYRMPNQYEVLPFVRCPGCGKIISDQSSRARAALDKLQENTYRRTAEESGIERGMTVEEYNLVIGKVIKDSRLEMDCCT